MLFSHRFKIKNCTTSEIFLIVLAGFTFLYALYIAVAYSNQALLDNFSFRQTQTALTAYWMVKDGFSLAYETPVAGPPWSIPFEFPIYQYLVALISQVTNISLDVTGRVVSFIFLTLCLIPAKSITKNLSLPNSVFYIFIALFFSSPLYLYYGRTFMIETAAVFFTIAAIKYFIDIAQLNGSFKSVLLFLVFMTLGILQKATTGLPVLAALSIIYFFLSVKDGASLKAFFTSKKIILALVYFGIPLMIGVIWTLYTDHIKLLNGLGENLTSSALGKWNWGTLSQRMSEVLYSDVIWGRMFYRNLGGLLGLAILMIALSSNAKKSIKLTIVILVLMGIIPLFLFTNLHIVHIYYQSGNLIFLIFAVALSLGYMSNNFLGKEITVVILTIIMVTSNYFWFSKDYLNVIKTDYNNENSRDFLVSDVLKRAIPQDKYFVAFGNDWNSSFAYLSGRKSFTVPRFFKQYDDIARNPERFIDEANLGGVVVCSSSNPPTIEDILQWSSKNRSWKIGVVHDCYVAVPESAQVITSDKVSNADCQGNIEYVGVIPSEKHNILSVSGWISNAGETGMLPEEIYVTMTNQNSEYAYYESLEVNRPNDNSIVFSRVIDTNVLSGEYEIGIAKLYDGHLVSCQFQKKVSIIDGYIDEEARVLE